MSLLCRVGRHAYGPALKRHPNPKPPLTNLRTLQPLGMEWITFHRCHHCGCGAWRMPAPSAPGFVPLTEVAA